MTDSHGLNSWLSELQEAGRTDSSGTFTLSQSKALDKLGEYQLPQPRLYVLNLLASAVAGGATFVKITVNSSRLVFEYDGETLSRSQLEGLFNQLLSPSSRYQQELAVALNAARSLNPALLTFESWNGQSGWLFQFREGFFTEELVAPSWEGQESRNRVTLEDQFQLTNFTRRWWGGSPEEMALIRTARYCPLEVSLNSKQLNFSVNFGCEPSSLAWLRLGPNEAPKIEVPDPQWSPFCLIEKPQPSLADFEAVLVLEEPERARELGLLIICNGVSFRRNQVVLGVPFACGIVWANSLKKNLSHTNLAEDNDYLELIESLKEMAEDLLIRRLDSSPLPSEVASYLTEKARTVAHELRWRGREGKSQAILRWLREAQFLKELDNESLWEELLGRVELGDEPGLALGQRLWGVLSEAATTCFRSGRLYESSRHHEKLSRLAQFLAPQDQAQHNDRVQVLRGLCGHAADPTCVEDQKLRFYLLRLLGRYNGTTEIISENGQWRELGGLSLAVGQFQRAERLLTRDWEETQRPEVGEMLSDCLAFAPPRDSARRKRSVAVREKALAGRAGLPEPCLRLFEADLVRLSAGSKSWIDVLGRRVRLSLDSVFSGAPLSELEATLERGRRQLQRDEIGVLTIKTAVLALETSFPPTHPIHEAARSRAICMLREAGLWVQADGLLARGRLFTRLCELEMPNP